MRSKYLEDPNIDHLLVPCSGSENLTLLVGAGVSGNLPGTRQVIQALLRVLFESFGKRRSKTIVASFLAQSIGTQKFNDPVRFEYLLQLVKDYFGKNLLFLKQIFEADVSPTHYHRGLAGLLCLPGNIVLTTNFDCQIENAYLELDRDRHLGVAFRKNHFAAALASPMLEGLFKLHGSVNDVRTLGATFDANRPSELKRRILETALSRAPLLVLGYGGSDDTDIVPALIHSRAPEQPIYWVVHDENCDPKAYSLDDSDDIPDSLKQENGFLVLRRMIEEGSRDRNRTFVIVGKSELVFHRLVASRGIEHLVDLDMEEDKESPRIKPVSDEEIEETIRKWYVRQDAQRDIRAMLLGTVLSYINGINNMPQRFARRLIELTENDQLWKVIALPKLAMAEVDRDRYRQAAELGHRGLTEAAIQWKKGGGTSHVRRLIVEAQLDSYAWLAESQRMLGNVDKAKNIAEEGLRTLRSIGFLAGWRRLRRIKGDLLSTIGEVQLIKGQLVDAKHNYSQASSEYKVASEWNWYWYAQLGLADILRMAGHLQAAHVDYERVRQGSYVTGWRTWLHLQIRLSELDLIFVWNGKLSHEEIGDLHALADNSVYDESMQAAAGMLLWVVQWGDSTRTPEVSDETYQQLLHDARGDPDFRASLQLYRAEYLKHIGQLSAAEKEIRSTIHHASRKDYELLKLHAQTVREDIRRLMGLQPDCSAIAKRYHKVNCPIGELYAKGISVAGGGNMTRTERGRLAHYAGMNGLQDYVQLFSDEEVSAKHQIQLHLRFPGIITNV